MDKKAAQIAVPPPTDPAFDASTPTSRKKIEANRRNAQLSTGPKSLEGKKIVAGNARKHGLLANNVVILTGDGKEDQAEFDGLLFQLHEYYKPVGVAEDLLVQEIAVSYWRSARALRCERGEVTLGSRIPLERSNLSEPTELLLEPQSDSDTQLTARDFSRSELPAQESRRGADRSEVHRICLERINQVPFSKFWSKLERFLRQTRSPNSIGR